MNRAADQIEKENPPRLVLAEADDAIGGDGQLVVLGDFVAVVTEGPDPAGIEIAVDIRPLQFLEALAVVDVAAGQGAEIGVGVLNNGVHDGIGTALALGPEW